MTQQTDLYRHYNEASKLLYIGVSFNSFIRLKAHKTESHWYNQISLITIEKFPTRAIALKAEAIAINIEKPLYNKTNNINGRFQDKNRKQVLVNITQLAEKMNVTRQTIHNMIKQNRITIPQIEGFRTPRWRYKDVEKWLALQNAKKNK